MNGWWSGLFTQPKSLSERLCYSHKSYQSRPLWGSRLGPYKYRWRTYGEIFGQAQAVGKLLKAEGLKTGDVVTINLPPSHEWVIADVACAMCFTFVLKLTPSGTALYPYRLTLWRVLAQWRMFGI